MSFLGNMFKRKSEAPAPKSKPEPAVAQKKPVVTIRPAAAAPKPKPQEMKLEDIVSALRQIQEVVGGTEDATTEPTAASKLSSIELRLKDIVGILPEAFDPDATASLSADDKTEILVEDLYVQLAKGRIETSVKHFLAGVSKHYLTSGYDAQKKQTVNLPLPLVVGAIDPTEFKKHTSGVERDLGLKDVPDVFAGANRQRPLSAALPPPAEPGTKAPAAAPSASPKPTIRIQPAAAAAPEPAREPEAPAPAPARPPEPKAEPKLQLKREPKLEPKPAAPVAATPPAEPAKPKPDAAQPAEPKAQPAVPPAARPLSIHVPKAAPLPPQEKPVLTTLKSLTEIPLTTKPAVEVKPAGPVAAEPAPAPVAAAPAEPVIPAKIALPFESLGTADARPHLTFRKTEAVEAPKPAAAAPQAPTAAVVPSLVLRGIDLNVAGADDLEYRLDGVARQLAERIVENRTQNGPFYDLYDLVRVPGLGYKVLEKITGQTWSGEIYRMLPTVIQVIGPWNARIPDLAGIVGRFQSIPGFEGCVLVHRDGDLLATSWDRQASESLEVMAPQIVKRVAQYMKHVCEDEALSVNVLMEGRAMTFVQNKEICFVAIHTARGFSKRHLQIVHGLGMVLGQRLSGGKPG